MVVLALPIELIIDTIELHLSGLDVQFKYIEFFKLNKFVKNVDENNQKDWFWKMLTGISYIFSTKKFKCAVPLAKSCFISEVGQVIVQWYGSQTFEANHPYIVFLIRADVAPQKYILSENLD